MRLRPVPQPWRLHDPPVAMPHVSEASQIPALDVARTRSAGAVHSALLRILHYQGTGTDHTAGRNRNPITEGCIHADKTVVSNPAVAGNHGVGCDEAMI